MLELQYTKEIHHGLLERDSIDQVGVNYYIHDWSFIMQNFLLNCPKCKKELAGRRVKVTLELLDG